MWFCWKIINSSRSHSKNWTHKMIVWYLQPDLGSGQKHVERPLTETTIAGSEDMTLPSVGIALPFYFTHFSSIKSVAFRCLCIKYMQSEKLNKEIAKWTRFLYIVQNIYKVWVFFSYFVNSQIMLNCLLDDCHLSYITKLGKNISLHHARCIHLEAS